MVDLTQLQSELQADPASLGYAVHRPQAPGMLAQMLNAPTTTLAKTRMVTARGIMASYGLGPSAGAAFLDKLEALSAGVPAIKWAMKFLHAESGIDVGEPATQAMLTSLTGVGGITQAEVDGVKAMALQPASRAEVLFGAEAQITEADVRAALEAAPAASEASEVLATWRGVTGDVDKEAAELAEITGEESSLARMSVALRTIRSLLV